MGSQDLPQASFVLICNLPVHSLHYWVAVVKQGFGPPVLALENKLFYLHALTSFFLRIFYTAAADSTSLPAGESDRKANHYLAHRNFLD